MAARSGHPPTPRCDQDLIGPHNAAKAYFRHAPELAEEQMREREDGKTLERGKWAQPSVPHKGWRCVDVIDLGEEGDKSAYEMCEMCESQEIRFVHVMENDRYTTDSGERVQLRCGCICAGHMEGDKVGAERRDKDMRNRALRRAKFPNRKGWYVNRNGHEVIKVDGHIIVVVSNAHGFHVRICQSRSQDWTPGRKNYPSTFEARLACFDALEYSKRKARD